MTSEIKTIVSKVFNTSKDNVKIIERLLGGKSHYTYLFSLDNKKYTIRLIGEGGNLFVDRKIEYENVKKIESLNLNNKTIYFDVNTGLKIAEYQEGTVLSDLNAHKYLKEIATAFKTLHNSKIKPVNNYNLIKRLKLYESYNITTDSNYLNLRNEWILLYEKYYFNRNLVFCHNDLQKNNMVIDKNNKIYLLDWEYAGLNDYFYDIASFGKYNIELLEVYLQRKPEKEEIRDVWFYKMFQNLQWYQVALYKDSIGLSVKLKVDFHELANYFISEANKHYLLIKDGY